MNEEQLFVPQIWSSIIIIIYQIGMYEHEWKHYKNKHDFR